MSPNARMWTAAAAAAALGLLAGVGVATYAQTQRITALEEQLSSAASSARTQETRIGVLESQIADLTRELEASDVSTLSPSAGAADTTAAPPAGAASTRQFAFVRAAQDDAGTITFSLDYAQFLTGQAAVAAAKAAGEEPPPNDYYVSNVNPRTRKLEVDPRATFVLAFASPTDTRRLSAGEFYDVIVNNTDGKAGAGYWFDIAEGRVTGGQEQWTP